MFVSDTQGNFDVFFFLKERILSSSPNCYLEFSKIYPLNSPLLLEQIGTENFLSCGHQGIFVVVKLVKSHALRILAERSNDLAFWNCTGRVIILVAALTVGY